MGWRTYNIYNFTCLNKSYEKFWPPQDKAAASGIATSVQFFYFLSKFYLEYYFIMVVEQAATQLISAEQPSLR